VSVFISHTIHTKSNGIEIYPIGDSHEGDESFTEVGNKKLNGYINYILDDNDRYTALMGDIMNGQTSAGPGKPTDEVVGYSQQKKNVYKRYLPLFKAGKVLFVLRGNHEDKVERQTLMKEDPIAELMFMWNQVCDYDVEALYGGYEALVDLKLRGKRAIGNRGGVRYVMYAAHGASGAATDGGRLNACKKLRNIADADIYLMGHVHKPLATFDDEMAVSPRGVPYMRERHYCINGAMLSRIPDWDLPSLSYPAKKAMAPVPMRYLKMVLGADDNKGKHIRVTV